MKKIILLFSLLFLSSNLFCYHVKTEFDTTKIDTSKITIGDRVFFSVLVRHENNTEIEFVEKYETDACNILSFNKNTFPKDSTKLTEFVFETAFFETGLQTFPSQKFKIITTDRNIEINSDSLNIFVRSSLKGDSVKLKDIKSPLSIKLSFIDIFIPLVTLAIIIFIMLLIFRLKKKKRILPQKKKKRIPAYRIALNKIEKLKLKDLLTKGQIKKFYIEISWITREYLENSYKLPILESTTYEIKNLLKKNNISYYPKFIKILRECDKVKYAKFIPNLSISNDLIEKLIELIMLTKPKEYSEEDENRIS